MIVAPHKYWSRFKTWGGTQESEASLPSVTLSHPNFPSRAGARCCASLSAADRRSPASPVPPSCSSCRSVCDSSLRLLSAMSGLGILSPIPSGCWWRIPCGSHDLRRSRRSTDHADESFLIEMVVVRESSRDTPVPHDHKAHTVHEAVILVWAIAVECPSSLDERLIRVNNFHNA